MTHSREMTRIASELPVPCLLCIGGLDPSGGAGLTADARAARAFGAHALPVLSCVVAQNTRGAREYQAVSPELFASQLDVLLEDVRPDAVKIGLLPGLALVEIASERLRALRDVLPDLPIVLDTVFAPSSGPQFVDDDTISYLASRLFPLCDLITPNLPEAARLLRVEEADNLDEVARQCAALFTRYHPKNVLLKGGHLPNNGSDETSHAADVLYDGASFLALRALRVQGYEVRGTGCLLASAIAAQLARGVEMPVAAREAKAWLTQQIQNAQIVGGGRRVAV